MEVVALNGSNNSAPFKREVHEWQHIDAKTGALLSGRLEADRYVNGNTNKYGKSVSQNIRTSDGVHSQHKQMNILQTITSNGNALQVIQAQTVRKSSSNRAITSTTYSSQFSSNFSNGHGSFSPGHHVNSDLLSINPRPLLHHETAPRLKALLSSSSSTSPSHLMALGSSSASTDNTSHRKNHLFHHANNDMNQNFVGIEQSRQQQLNEMLYGSNKESFNLRGRSASIEDLTNIDESSFDGDVEPCEWKRVSKIRRSLQFPKTSETRRFYTRPPDLPENSVNVLKIKQDIENIENSRRLNTAMKNNHVDFVALDSILKESSLNSQHDDDDDKKDETKDSNCITADSLKEIRRRLKKLNNETDLYKDDEHKMLEQNCKSLELKRNRERDTTSDDWLNRRKSYGFEKMHHQPTETFGGIESSTDSGLGRSSDLSSNWSPTVDTQRTIITFGDRTKPATTSISLFSNPISQDTAKPVPMRRSTEKKEELKRHSIAVDESRYVDDQYRSSNDRKISLVNLNIERPSSNEGFLDDNRRHKKVEFCKTEIHFAADSGRVNIVETDGKPPPTSNFRRRKRTPGAYIDETESIFNEESRNSESPLMEIGQSNVTTTIGNVFGTSRDDDTDDGTSEDSSLRGILKNKVMKPKPYHLGENMDANLWGIRLKPVENQHAKWRHSADFDSVVTKKSSIDDTLEMELEFKNLVKAIDDTPSQYQSTVTNNNGYSTKINLSATPTSHQTASSTNKDTFAPSSSSLLSSAHKSSTFTSFTDSRATNGNETFKDKDQQQPRGHKISIDLKLPHPSSIDTIMDELKSTSLIIKTMKSTSYFDDAMRHLEQESPLIRTSSLRLNQDSLPKSSSTSMMYRKQQQYQPEKAQRVKYSSSLDGDHGILDSHNREDDFGFLNGFLEENRKFQLSIAEKERKSPQQQRDIYKPIAAPRLKKIMNPNIQLSQQLSQLKHLYDNANDSDDNAKADEEVKSYLGKHDEERSSELSGSWSRVRVKKIASAFQSSLENTEKWPKVPLTSLYEHSTSKTIEASPRTSLIQIGTDNNKSHNNLYSNVTTSNKPQENSVKVNIQNFETRSPALSRNNSLRIKKDDTSTQQKLSTGTRQLREHELTYFGVQSNKPTTTTDSKTFAHLSTSKLLSSTSSSTIINSSLKSSFTNPIVQQSVIAVNHQKQISEKPDLIMHHNHQPSTPELTTSEKKSMLETLDSCIDETKNLEPLYENLYHNQKSKYDRKTDLARDEKILSELTRAADEIMNTCKEMYHADSEEKRRKSLLGNNTTCLETISEGRQPQRGAIVESQQQKIMKSKGVQVSRNFEDSLRRYNPAPQRTSSQSSLDSLPRNSKVSSLSSTASRSKTKTTKSSESNVSTTMSSSKSSTSKKRENGFNSDGSKNRIQRVSSRERMQQSNASSSEDLPNSSSEAPRRPRRTKVLKHKDENGKDEKRTSRLTRSTESSLRRSARGEQHGHSKVSNETKVRSSTTTKSSVLNSLSSTGTHPTAATPTTYVSETVMIPPRRKNYRRRKVIRRNSSLKSKSRTPTKRISRQTRRTQLESCICS
ncbi:CLUMA_CG014241, isoform A [Clunio marinus]|uniref:CLUMA_CG014241, isoform A n=1 Tax=Clunio marinus TaxID=568069 RepID=A0A1J1INA4_9DIPT|nr:CLUMA_CG014241, isoform A [Clunio marinus]